MNRKTTILIAALVNAGLLAVLFIAALTTQEELAPTPQLVHSSIQEIEPPKPLFTEALDQTLRETPSPPPAALTIHPLPSRAPDPAPIAEALPPPPTPISAPDYLEITVKKGDSLDKIAKAHHTSVSELIKLNHLPSSFLRIGQQIKVPTKKSPPPKLSTPLPTDTTEYYTIKVGDNPWSIALKHHLKVEELLRLNGLNEEKAKKLKPGDRLRIR